MEDMSKGVGTIAFLGLVALIAVALWCGYHFVEFAAKVWALYVAGVL